MPRGAYRRRREGVNPNHEQRAHTARVGRGGGGGDGVMAVMRGEGGEGVLTFSRHVALDSAIRADECGGGSAIRGGHDALELVDGVIMVIGDALGVDHGVIAEARDEEGGGSSGTFGALDEASSAWPGAIGRQESRGGAGGVTGGRWRACSHRRSEGATRVEP